MTAKVLDVLVAYRLLAHMRAKFPLGIKPVLLNRIAAKAIPAAADAAVVAVHTRPSIA
jgi:hypothetical protein